MSSNGSRIDNETFTESVILATDALARVLGSNRKGTKVCTVKIWQFGTNLLYLPVYLLLAEIKKCWDRKHWCGELGGTLEIEYQNFVKDTLVCQAVGNQCVCWSSENVNTLVIGLSELLKDSSKDRWYIESKLIKRLPLWGVALANNPKINSLKRQSQSGKNNGLEPEAGKSREVRHDYWKVFGGKLSLLKPSDLVDDDLRLGMSLYKSGTTANRLFVDDFLKKLKKPISFTSEVTFENEFDDLFHGIVDVALTVQPWQAVRNAAELGYKLETVYVHQGKPESFTSIYCKKPANSSDENLLGLLLNILHIGVQEKIAALYELNDELGSYLSVLYKVEGKANSKADELKESDAKTDIGEFSEDHLNCALHLISDSRIYYYDTVNMDTKDRWENQEMLRRQFVTCADSWDDMELADPIATVTSCIAQIPELAHHRDITIQTLRSDERYKKYIFSIEVIDKVVKNCGIESETYNELDGNGLEKIWRNQNLAELLPEIATTHCENDNFFREDYWRPGKSDYTFWFPIKTLQDALFPFRHQFIRETNALTYQKSKIGLLTAGEFGFAWAWITYTVQHVITKDPKDWDIAKNTLAQKLLHGWYVPPDLESFNPMPLLNRKHPLVLTRGDEQVNLCYGEDKVTLELPANNHGFLFTFGVTNKE